MILMGAFSFMPEDVGADGPPSRIVRFQEVVTDPKQDRNDNDLVTAVDEMIVLVNDVDHPVDLTGWRLYMEDTTPAEDLLEGTLQPGARHVIINPGGTLNNDVHLWLFDDGGDLVDRVHLGTDAPNGRSTDLLDEAVYMSGPWAGQQGPAANGHGLGPVWVEQVVPTTALDPPLPLQPTWLPAGPAAVEVRLHVAPGHEGTALLLAGAEAYPLEAQPDGSFVAHDVALPGDEGALSLRVGDETTTSWPDGRPLRFPVDRVTPRIESPHEAVMNATRHVHWLPPVVDDESGLGRIKAMAGSGNPWTLPDCVLPSDGPATCPLPDNVTALRLVAWDQAGNRVDESLALVESTHAPVMPHTFTFDTGVPPTMHWPAFDEVLVALRIETADDIGGTWNRTNVSLTPTATVFTDEDWTPGAPRAYRLVATGRGGETAAGPWVALPEEAVPVTHSLTGLDAVVQHLLDHQDAPVEARFDRALQHVPVLVLDIDQPRPYRLVVNGSLSPDARTGSWSATADGFPRSGSGHWSFGGGAGRDGAPLATLRLPVSWDLEAPRLDLTGVVEGWVRADRHVVMVSARDMGPVPPQITVQAAGAVVSEHPGRVDVLLRGEGAHLVSVTADDAAGNRAEEHVTIRLDATPPEVRLVEIPEVWSRQTPLVLEGTDNGSGIDPASFTIEVRTSDGTFDPNVTWNGTHARLVPEDPVPGPFELQVGVADDAGNQVIGLLGARLSSPGLPVQVVLNGTASQGNTTEDVGPSTGPVQAGGLSGPVGAEPGTSWRDLTVPMSDPGVDDTSDGATTAWSWVAGVVGAGVVGLGTMVRRRQRTRGPLPQSAQDEEPAEGTDGGPKEDLPAPSSGSGEEVPTFAPHDDDRGGAAAEAQGAEDPQENRGEKTQEKTQDQSPP